MKINFTGCDEQEVACQEAIPIEPAPVESEPPMSVVQIPPVLNTPVAHIMSLLIIFVALSQTTVATSNH